jgi:hypothetical protein
VSIERLRGVAAECSKLYLIRGRYTNTNTQSEAPADKEEAYEPRRSAKMRPAHLSSYPKYSNALPLRLSAACVLHALHPTDKFDAYVCKDTQPENTRVQPPQGVPAFHLANIEPAHLDACVCVKAWFKSREVQKRRYGKGPKSLFRSIQTDKHRDQIRYETI